MDFAQDDLVHVARLALSQQAEDVRLYVARLVRKYRSANPDLANELNAVLRNSTTKAQAAMNKQDALHALRNLTVPSDNESRLSLLKVFEDASDRQQPLLSPELKRRLEQLIQERRQVKRLASSGLQPTRSAFFVGPPGVGKTLTARWVASQLQLPLFVLDLTAVMSSLLGRSGSNLRAALDFAKTRPCVLLLDEVDSIAKRRSDDTDVGELKRLVTVILQEVDAWPASSLLLAATNFPELIDPALWRRFDLKIEFEIPSVDVIHQAVRQFLGSDRDRFEAWAEVLPFVFMGRSFSDIEREIQRFRRALVLRTATPGGLIEGYLQSRIFSLDRKEKVEFAVMLANNTHLSQHSISDITGVSRDTIRKHAKTKIAKVCI